MQVLVLAWGVEPGPLGPSGQAAGLVRALAAVGHDVRLVTRRDADVTNRLDGVEVHAVVDPPPIIPTAMAAPTLDALAVAGRATSVAVRRLEEQPVDVVHAEGWMTAPVVAALRHSHGITTLAAVEPWETSAPDATVAELAAALVTTADVRVRRAPGGAPVLPAGTDLPPRPPGPPPARGPVHLTAPPGAGHGATARRVRAALASPRRISRSWGRRPAVVVVLDPHDLGAVARGFAAGVPIVTVAGPAGALVEDAGAGLVVAPDPTAVAGAVDELVIDRTTAVALGAAARAASTQHAWPHVATVWTTLATAATQQTSGPRLHAAG